MDFRQIEQDGLVEMQIPSAAGQLLAPLIVLGPLLAIGGGLLRLAGLMPAAVPSLVAMGLVGLAVGLWAIFGATQVVRVKPGLLSVRPSPFGWMRHYEASRISDLAVIDRPPEHRRELSAGRNAPASEITCLYDGRLRTIARGLEAREAHEIYQVIRRTLYR